MNEIDAEFNSNDYVFTVVSECMSVLNKHYKELRKTSLSAGKIVSLQCTVASSLAITLILPLLQDEEAFNSEKIIATICSSIYEACLNPEKSKASGFIKEVVKQ